MLVASSMHAHSTAPNFPPVACCGTSKHTRTHLQQTAPGREVLTVLGSPGQQSVPRIELSVGCALSQGLPQGNLRRVESGLPCLFTPEVFTAS